MSRIVLIRSNPVEPDPPVEKMANTLLKNGHEVIILAWDRSHEYYVKEEKKQFLDGYVQIVKFGIPAQFAGGFKKTLKQLIKFQMRIKKWLSNNKNKYDMIHAFDFDTGLIAFLCAKKFHKKIIYHILDYYVESHRLHGTKIGYVVAKLENYLINQVDATIICTEKRKEQIKGTTPKKLVIVHNTPQNDINIKMSLEMKGNKERCKIVYVGILGGARFIIETAKFVMENEKFEFHIGGFGQLEENIKELTQKCDRIFYYGKLPYEETLALEVKSDVMIAIYDPNIPNHKYAAPNKFYESLMLGKPIIMAKDTGFDQIIEENNIGCIIEYSKRGLETALEALVQNKEKWIEMSQKSKMLYENNYSWAIMEKRIVELYKNI